MVMVQKTIRDLKSSVSIKNCPCHKDFMSENENKSFLHKVTGFGAGVGKWGALSFWNNRESESLFDCEPEEELKVVIKYKEKVFSSWDPYIVQVDFERKSRTLNGYVKQLLESHDLDATTKKIKDMIIEDSKLADVLNLNPSVFERLAEILDDNKNNESTKGSAACILAFADFNKCGDDIKEKATKVLVKHMSDERDTISIPVLRTLTRLAYNSSENAKFIIENDALQGALAVFEPIFPSLKRIQNLAKFLVVVVHQRKVPDDKVGIVVTILDKILEVRESNLRCIVRACYTLSNIPVECWINEGNILDNIIDLIWHYDDMIAFSALRVAAYIVKSENPCKILTKNYKFLQYFGWSKIYCKPKKCRMEACHIISNMVANGGTSLKDLEECDLMDALFKLLEVDDFDVRIGAACAIHDVISCHKE